MGDPLERLKPKEPVAIENYDNPYLPPDLVVGRCPICNGLLTNRCNYCSQCGQKLLWNGGDQSNEV